MIDNKTIKYALQSCGNIKFRTDRFNFPADKFKEIIIQIGTAIRPEFVIDSENKDFFNTLYHWFFNIPDKIDLKKGLYIKSNVGRGKSLAIMVFEVISQWYKKNNSSYNKNFEVNEVLEIVFSYKADLTKFDLTKNDKIINTYNDLGREGTKDQKEVVCFGERINVMNLVLEMEYLKFQRRGIPCIITSNYDWDRCKQWYGVEMVSRFNEMFNYVELIGLDRRKTLPESHKGKK